jgi:NAD+ synthase (glutamine-hydrolysing)
VFSPSSSPGRGVAEGGDLGTAESCRLMDRFYAQYLTLYVLFANRVGHEDGIAFWGGSEVVAPDGSVVERAPDFEEHLLVAEIDPDLVARERDRNPLIRDERPDLVQSHLSRRTGLVRRPDVAVERS